MHMLSVYRYALFGIPMYWFTIFMYRYTDDIVSVFRYQIYTSVYRWFSIGITTRVGVITSIERMFYIVIMGQNTSLYRRMGMRNPVHRWKTSISRRLWYAFPVYRYNNRRFRDEWEWAVSVSRMQMYRYIDKMTPFSRTTGTWSGYNAHGHKQP